MDDFNEHQTERLQPFNQFLSNRQYHTDATGCAQNSDRDQLEQVSSIQHQHDSFNHNHNHHYNLHHHNHNHHHNQQHQQHLLLLRQTSSNSDHYCSCTFFSSNMRRRCQYNAFPLAGSNIQDSIQDNQSHSNENPVTIIMTPNDYSDQGQHSSNNQQSNLNFHNHLDVEQMSRDHANIHSNHDHQANIIDQVQYRTHDHSSMNSDPDYRFESYGQHHQRLERRADGETEAICIESIANYNSNIDIFTSQNHLRTSHQANNLPNQAQNIIPTQDTVTIGNSNDNDNNESFYSRGYNYSNHHPQNYVNTNNYQGESLISSDLHLYRSSNRQHTSNGFQDGTSHSDAYYQNHNYDLRLEQCARYQIESQSNESEAQNQCQQMEQTQKYQTNLIEAQDLANNNQSKDDCVSSLQIDMSISNQLSSSVYSNTSDTVSSLCNTSKQSIIRSNESAGDISIYGQNFHERGYQVMEYAHSLRSADSQSQTSDEPLESYVVRKLSSNMSESNNITSLHNEDTESTNNADNESLINNISRDQSADRMFGSQPMNSASKLATNSGLTTTHQTKVNKCPICDRNYARPSTLKTHLRTHTNERPFNCSVCHKTFSQAANLTAHQRVHTGERPFACPLCGRQFSQSSSVITHLRTHSGERPYRCNICNRTFSDSSTLTKHCRIHSGEKPYQCNYCPLNFSQSGNLSRHLKLHFLSSKQQQQNHFDQNQRKDTNHSQRDHQTTRVDCSNSTIGSVT